MGAAVYIPSQSNRTLVSSIIVCAVFIPPCSVTAEKGRGPRLLACEDFGRVFDIDFSPAIFSKVEINWRTMIPLFMPGSAHNDTAS